MIGTFAFGANTFLVAKNETKILFQQFEDRFDFKGV